MTTKDKLLVMQAAAFAKEFIKEADRASAGLPNQTHDAAAQLRAALNDLPPVIEGCSCDCKGFNEVKKVTQNSVWIPCEKLLPPDGELVETKIDDAKGIRNERPLKRERDRWFIVNDRYVYYTPTHWRPLPQVSA